MLESVILSQKQATLALGRYRLSFINGVLDEAWLTSRESCRTESMMN